MTTTTTTTRRGKNGFYFKLKGLERCNKIMKCEERQTEPNLCLDQGEGMDEMRYSIGKGTYQN